MITPKSPSLCFNSTAPSNYGGPPMWDRGYDNPEYRRYRAPVPPIRGPGGGPQVNHASIAGIVMVRNIRIESLKAIGCLGSQIAMTMKIKDNHDNLHWRRSW